MRGLPALARPSAPFSMLRPGADPSTIPSYAASRARRGLLSGILESVGDFLGFGNNQAHPADPKTTGNGGASSTASSHEPTSVKPPAAHPSPPAPAPPASYPAPGGGGQAYKPTSTAPVSVSSVPKISSAGNAVGPALHSTSPPAAMTVVPTQSTAPPARQSQPVSDVYGVPATSLPVSPGWSSISPPASGATPSAPSPTDPPTTAAHAKQFPLAAAAAIGAVLGFLVVSALFWAVWLALRRRRRAYPEFASVHPKRVSVPDAESVSADGNPFAHPHDEKEDDPFELPRASSARSTASTLSV